MMWIPLRSAKMNWRILGFHRRVWCPKWTPAARRASSVGVPVDDCVSAMCGTNLGLVVDVGSRHRVRPPVAWHRVKRSEVLRDELQYCGTADSPAAMRPENDNS